MDTVDTPAKPIRLQLSLFLILVITLVLSIWVRLMGAGWYLIFFGIPLLILAVLHLLFQVSAIRKISKMKPAYAAVILASDLLFFLGFALQVDFGDAPGAYLAIAAFYGYYFGSGAKPIPDGLSSSFMVISIICLVAVIASWVILHRASFLKRDGDNGK